MVSSLYLRATRALRGLALLGVVGGLSAPIGALAQGPAAAPPAAEGSAGTGAGAAEGSSDQLAARQAAIDEALAEHTAGHDAAAWARIEAYIAAHPDDLMVAVLYSRSLSARNQFDAAMDFLRDHLQRHPDSHAAALELAVLLIAYLDFESAIPFLEHIAPSAGVIYEIARLNLGVAYRAVGRLEEARQLYTRLLDTGSRAFAEAALCEIDLAEGALDACRQRLAAAQQALGDQPALAQPAILLDYLTGDFDDARTRLDAVAGQGPLSSRLRTMRVLLALARGQPEEAEGALARLEGVTVRGERDALMALVQAASGRPDLAQTALRAARERNPLFADVAEAGRVLVWRPDAVALLAGLDADGSGAASSRAGSGAPVVAATASDGSAPAAGTAETPQTGCCRTAGGAGSGGLIFWIAALALLAGRRLKISDRRALDSRGSTARS